MESKQKQRVDIFLVFERILQRKHQFLVVAIITTIIASLLIIPMPRYYQCSVVLAPENSMGNERTMGSFTSALGLNMGGVLTSDAIYPDLYPQVLESNDFIKKLINTQVVNEDGSLRTSYYEYMRKHQKSNVLLKPFNKMKEWIKDFFTSEKDKNTGNLNEMNLFRLTKEQNSIFGAISDKIECDISIKTGAITISVKDQDPVICATIADAVRTNLQDFIIEYRTNKSKIDVEHYKVLTAEAKQAYEKARQLYGSFSDSNMDVIMQSYKLKENDLENDMQLKFNTYTLMQNQLQMAQAKLQERTPAFTVIKRASVPQKPAGPKRMAFVLTIVFLAMIATAFYVNKDLIKEAIRDNS